MFSLPEACSFGHSEISAINYGDGLMVNLKLVVKKKIKCGCQDSNLGKHFTSFFADAKNLGKIVELKLNRYTGVVKK